MIDVNFGLDRAHGTPLHQEKSKQGQSLRTA